MLGEGGTDSWSEHLRRLSRKGVTVVERELDAERFERLEQFAQRHRIIPRERIFGSLRAALSRTIIREALFVIKMSPD